MFSYLGKLSRIALSFKLSTDHYKDPIHARFEPCVLPFIAAIPALVSICIFIFLALANLPRGWLSPKWTRTFVEEPKEEEQELFGRRKISYSRSTVLLLVLSVIGLALQLLTIFRPTFRLQMIYPAASWAFSCLLIAIYRPTSTPQSLLVLYISIFVSQFAILADSVTVVLTNDLPAIFALLSSLGATIVILLMPLRDQNLPSEGISPTFSPPTSELRTPEDDLTLWQFMSVSWMAPLISLGNSRQLNDDDVWFLGYEFQHRKLHDRFRELQGSVIKRLLEANGIDLLIISMLACIEQFASKSTKLITAATFAYTVQIFPLPCFCKKYFNRWKMKMHPDEPL